MDVVFGAYTLNLARRELRRGAAVLPLEPKAFTVLAYLCTHRDRAIPKEELLEACWPEAVVNESALTRCVRVLRQALADDGGRQQVIKTLRGYGYRFVAVVVEGPAPSAPSSPLPHDAPALLPPAGAGGQDMRAASPPTATAAGLACPQCQTVNRTGRQFCAACGQALWHPCLHCGFGNGSAEHFCGGCGRALATWVPVTSAVRSGPPRAYTPAHLADKIFASPPGLLGERKYATVVVVTLEGLQTLRHTTSAETVDDLLNQGFAQLVAEVHRVDGFLAQVTSQGGIALFGVPLACEDHVLRALHASLGMQRVFAPFAAALHQRYGVGLALRLGVHTGPLVVNAISPELRVTYTAPGTTLEVATGLQQLGQAGAIVVSAAVQEHAAGFFRFTALGAYTLSALAESVRVYRCDGVGPVTSRLEGALGRGRTPFQGRTRELALLEACWARVGQGTGQVVCLVGEAGIGKSRLADEWQRRLALPHRLTAQALSYGQAMPYHAVLPLLRRLLGIVETATPAQQRQALRAHLTEVDPALAVDIPLLAQMLGIPLDPEPSPARTPEAQRRRFQHACLQVLGQQAATRPVCLLVEDCHWLDPSSQEVLDGLVATLPGRPLMLLCTARPGWRHPWTDASAFHHLAVAPLTATEVDTILHDLVQPYEASPALAAWTRERTGGNPLFVEELVRTLHVQGSLVLQDGRYEVAAPARATLPTSIQGLVQARLDRLPVADKYVLQVASVLGLDVPGPLLDALLGATGEERWQSLHHLQAAELLYATRTGPHAVYTFKHALVQEAAYQSLLPSARGQLHQQIARVMEAQFPEWVEAQPALLAQHFTAAHLPAQAIPYWHQAGHRAIARSANIEAIRHLTQGLDLLATLPETTERAQRELSLALTLGAPLLMTKGYAAPEIERVYSRVQQLCQQLGDTSQVFTALYGLCAFYLVRGECHTARQFGQQALHLAQEIQAHDLILLGHAVLGATLYCCADLAKALEHFKEGSSRYDPVQHHGLAFRYGDDPGAFCLAYMNVTLWLLGYPDQAQECGRAALALSQRLGHPFGRALPLLAAAVSSQFRWEEACTHTWAETMLTLVTEQGFAYWLGAGIILRGWALARQGDTHAGLEQQYQGWSAWHATSAKLLEPYWLALRAETHWLADQVPEGLHTIEMALAASAHNHEPWWDAHLYWLKGELLWAQRDSLSASREVEACFQQAIRVARSQQAKSLELRAATSLARLWQSQGKCQAAHALLAPIYGWFTEGFDTADLRKAKMLLEALT